MVEAALGAEPACNGNDQRDDEPRKPAAKASPALPCLGGGHAVPKRPRAGEAHVKRQAEADGQEQRQPFVVRRHGAQPEARQHDRPGDPHQNTRDQVGQPLHGPAPHGAVGPEGEGQVVDEPGEHALPQLAATHGRRRPLGRGAKRGPQFGELQVQVGVKRHAQDWREPEECGGRDRHLNKRELRLPGWDEEVRILNGQERDADKGEVGEQPQPCRPRHARERGNARKRLLLPGRP